MIRLRTWVWWGGEDEFHKIQKYLLLLQKQLAYCFFFVYSFVQKLNMKENSRISRIWSMGLNLFLRILEIGWKSYFHIYKYSVSPIVPGTYVAFRCILLNAKPVQCHWHLLSAAPCCPFFSHQKEKYHSSQSWHPIALGKICEFNYI